MRLIFQTCTSFYTERIVWGIFIQVGNPCWLLMFDFRKRTFFSSSHRFFYLNCTANFFTFHENEIEVTILIKIFFPTFWNPICCQYCWLYGHIHNSIALVSLFFVPFSSGTECLGEGKKCFERFPTCKGNNDFLQIINQLCRICGILPHFRFDYFPSNWLWHFFFTSNCFTCPAVGAPTNWSDAIHKKIIYFVFMVLSLCLKLNSILFPSDSGFRVYTAFQCIVSLFVVSKIQTRIASPLLHSHEYDSNSLKCSELYFW